MFARVARYQIPEENLDDAVEGFREAIEDSAISRATRAATCSSTATTAPR